MQKFLTNLVLLLAIIGVLFFFSPLSAMLDIWKPAYIEDKAPVAEEPEVPATDPEPAASEEPIDEEPDGTEPTADQPSTSEPVETVEDAPGEAEPAELADEPEDEVIADTAEETPAP